ncbi:hypothetical protein VQL36_01975 [Chengkuizengella sp. SCS-71B]|uniref:hypothetical protein n=1 Tax=Chengkuizengella sp. SCS-71B TaxID=3115290 RepID=UPI0032C22841
MGLKKGSFVVADTVSVDDPYDINDPNVINLVGDAPTVVASVDVCIKQPQKTQVSLDSMAQIAVIDEEANVTFEVIYEILRNDTTIATINDEMDYVTANQGRHTNFPNFPLVDNNPSAGLNTYNLRCTLVTPPPEGSLTVGSRSLKATVFEC